ncbi:3-oxoacyl-ACP reductase [Salipaludibacillus keqinensis]|uniref:3-oxoacyl-ACP reductase n=1 Tax=Salipaludibacillus keqinensis TaxID=2045207 RepID=A0A323TCL9_9BACI|nr:SDR family oxidoreductase [Salipaludibacillus keqinensis]PYZ93082.1 3-oxoacyl-ACP reductase [Salipaludibacillus keqinensis]
MHSSSPLAFITGASGGIGGSISLRLASLGYDVVLHYCQNRDSVEQLKATIEDKYGQSCTLLQADFRHTSETLEKINHLNLQPEVIVHNSGSGQTTLFQDVGTSELTSQISINLTTPSLITKMFLPKMLSMKRGHIIMITSIWGLTGASCEVTYSMVKGGQNSFVKALAKEVAPSGLQVNGIAPGAIDTEMLAHYSSEDIRLLKEDIPAGRLGSTREIAGTVAFLLSEDARYINGQIISVNGAWYC